MPERIPLDQLEARAQACRACPLWETRTNLVFGTGNPQARVLFIGEAPGADEDAQGEPFVGRSGQLLNELFALAGLARDEVYIANILKCRPPGNRNPLPSEIEACTPHLREQTRTIDPEFIVTVGTFATQFVLKTDQRISRLRGQVHQAGRFKVYPVFHPSYALRNRTSVLPVLQDDFRALGVLLGSAPAKAAAPNDAEAKGTFGDDSHTDERLF